MHSALSPNLHTLIQYLDSIANTVKALLSPQGLIKFFGVLKGGLMKGGGFLEKGAFF